MKIKDLKHRLINLKSNMDPYGAKHNPEENENERKRKKPDLRYPSSIKRERHQRPANETNEHDEARAATKLYDLPIEITDLILQKSYLHWILNSPANQRNEDVIGSLISVDVCFYRRIIRRRFKKAIWRYLKDVYEETRTKFALIRNSRDYLLENIRPNKELISSLLSLNCITPIYSHLLQRRRFNRNKNDYLLKAMRPFDEERLSNFIKCLRQTSQKTVARIIENGGVVIKIKVKTRGESYAASARMAILHKNIEDLQSRNNPFSEGTGKFFRQLRENGIEILNSHLDGQTVVVWIWCHSQAALEDMQTLCESNQLRDGVFEFIQPYTFKIIDVDRNQFKKTVVEYPVCINFTQIIETRVNEALFGVTKLRNEIYVLCRLYSNDPIVILVHEDRDQFPLNPLVPSVLKNGTLL